MADFEYHAARVKAARDCLDAALLAAKLDGFDTNIAVVQPSQTTAQRFVFITMGRQVK